MAKDWKRFSASVAQDTIAFAARNWKVLLIYGVIIAFLAILPLVERLTESLSDLLRTDFMTLLIFTLLYISLTQSWNIIGGYAGQINLGHAAFFGMGFLVGRQLLLAGVPVPLALLAGCATAVLLALLIGLPAFRLRGVYFIIGTLALAEILRLTVGNVLFQASRLPVEYLAGYSITPRYFVILGLAVVVVATVYVLSRSRLGLGMLAVREDEDTAEATGVNTLKYKMVAFALSALFAGFAGAAFAYYFKGGYYYHAAFHPVAWTFIPLMMVFVGGVGSVIGPILGSVFYVVFSRALAVTWPGAVHLLIFGALFLLVVFFFPGGLVELLGKVRRWLFPAKEEVRPA